MLDTRETRNAKPKHAKMKYQFHEGKFGGNISLEPETVQESAQLARLVLNAKREPLQISMSFGESGTIEANIHINKLEQHRQTNYINNRRKK